jgi:hypothetical protein
MWLSMFDITLVMHGSERWSGNCAVRNLGLDRMISKMWLGNQLQDARLSLPHKLF